MTSMNRIAPAALRIEVAHLCRGTTDRQRFEQELALRRVVDARRGTATFGPHRDDLEILVDGRLARSHASQGQQRLITLGLKMAELEVVRSVTDQEPILLLDDVSSELDEERLAAVFSFLEGTESQVFVTTTRPELFDRVAVKRGDRADFRLDHGALRSDPVEGADHS
jgi:DNA replication and repair protein RecF